MLLLNQRRPRFGYLCEKEHLRMMETTTRVEVATGTEAM